MQTLNNGNKEYKIIQYLTLKKVLFYNAVQSDQSSQFPFQMCDVNFLLIGC